MSKALREAAQQALECLESLQGGCTDSGDGTVEAITVWCPEVIDALRTALAQHPKRVPTHRIKSWGFCGVCRHDRIPGEGCARQECPDSPQQAEPVLQTCNFRWDGEVQVQQCTRAHGIGEEK